MGKIKFKLSLKELNFEFEGDQDTGAKFQESITKTLNSITETPNQIIDVDAKRIDDNHLLGSPIDLPTKQKRKSRRKKSNNNNADSNGSSGEKSRTIRPKGESARDLILLLIQENFFTSYKAVNEIQEELAKKGHNFTTTSLSTPLIRLTKKDFLSRDNSSGNWKYKKGIKDVPTGS